MKTTLQGAGLLAIHLALACSGSSEPADELAGGEDMESPSGSPSSDSGTAGMEGVGGVGGNGPTGPGGGGNGPGSGVGGESPGQSNGGAAAGGAAAGGGVAMPTGEPLPLVLDGEPQHFRYVRLTHEQWENSVRDNLRLPGPSGLGDGFTPDVRGVHRYSNNEGLLFVRSPLALEYAEAAEALAREVTSDAAQLLAVYEGSDATGFIEEVGRRFYRRPLTTEEAARFEEIFQVGSTLPSASDAFSGGARLVLEVLMQSPRFLYRIEHGNTGERLDGYALATKLAYLLTDTTPSDALLAQAAAGELDSDEGLRARALELLATPRATEALRRFHSETLHVERLAGIVKNADSDYPEGSNELLLESSHRFFDHLFEQSLGVRDLFLSDVAFADAAMADRYAVDPPEGTGLGQVRLGADRSGYFTQLPFLTLYASNLTPDPIHRGIVLNADVLCAELPPEVPMQPPLGEIAAEQTNRERVTESTAMEACGVCHHTYINPLGFAFEGFDGLGRARELDNGRPVDTRGSYPFVEGQLEFAGALELMQLLAESHQAHRCYASHIGEFALAHDLGAEEDPVVEALTGASLDEGASIHDLMLAAILTPAFHTRQEAP